ncbi:MAG: site-specific DNA-methyltransferase [Campylobacter sp.]|nr:site-specific DNA-methyltransferase [Campylobacter sp.]
MITKDDAIKHNVKILDDKKDEATKLKEYLKKNFPSAIKDETISFKALAEILGLSDKISGYELTWTGKALANELYNAPTKKELKLKDGDLNVLNHLIIADNLDALKILESAYFESIKMIYIDPPYNTKNENFIYPDNFRDDYKDILKRLELLSVDDDGNEVESENLRFLKNITSSKSHSGWLNFMLPRLKLARNLLKNDGVIFISIDDNEMANLKILCDEIFGEENFISCMPRVTKKAGKSTDNIANNHDYVLVYSKNNANFKQILVDEDNYKEIDEFFDKRGGYKLNQTLDYDSLQYNKTMDFEIKINDKQYYPGGDYDKFIDRENGKFNRIDWVWRWSKEKFDFGLKNGFVEIRNNRIYTKTYYKAKISDKKPYKIEYIDRTKNISSLELIDNKFSNDYANKVLQRIFNQKNIFDYSKSPELIKFFVEQICSNSNDNDIILDFFAGSGTTAHAVIEANLNDNGNRKFILVQIDEKIDEKKSKTAYEFCKNELKSINPSIADITNERIKRSISLLKSDTKFNVYETNDKTDIEVAKDGNLTLNFSSKKPTDIARNLALKIGKTLDKNIDEILKDRLFISDGVLIIVSCDKEVLESLKSYENSEIFLNGYDDISLENFLNLKLIADERLRVVF